jgi:predicted dehydrogenase
MWRGWLDFGTGAVGDMGCHTLHVIVRALKLGHPSRIHSTSNRVVRSSLKLVDGRMSLRPEIAAFAETFPLASIITWDFPARGALPPVRVTWYEGGLKPPRPADLPPSEVLKADGILFIGDKGTLLSGFTGGPRLLPEAKMSAYTPPPKTIPRTAGHYEEWIAACKGGPPANCNFEFGGLLTEIGLLGTLAVRTGKALEWDPENLRITNEPDANQYIQEPYRQGWSL